MTAAALPLPRPAGGRGNYVPTRRDIESHLRARFPKLTASAANRTARAALDVRGVRPEVDVLVWAEKDVLRRLSLVGVPLLMRGFDPTPVNALRNIAVGVTSA